jgi:hypothetical protein
MLESRSRPGAVGGAEELKWQAKYVEARMRQQLVANNTHGSLPADLLLSGRASKQLHPQSSFAREANKCARELERVHDIQTPWEPADEEFKLGLVELLAHEIRALQGKAECGVREISLVELVFRSVFGRRLEARRLEDVKQVRQRLHVLALLGARWTVSLW